MTVRSSLLMARSALDADDAFLRGAVRAFALDQPAPKPPDGSTWVERATLSGVLPQVVDVMRRSDLVVPPELESIRRHVVIGQMRTLLDLADASARLDSAGVRWAVLKGPVLSSMVYRRPGVRSYTDLDVLVSPEQIRVAVDVLLDGGATLQPADWGWVVPDRTAELVLRLPHGTDLDLHWHLVNIGRIRDGFRFDADMLLDRRVDVDLDGTSATTLSADDFVLHVLLHACLSGCWSLRWLLDVQQALGWLSTPPERLAERARELGVTLPARVVLDSVANNLDPSATRWADAMGSPGGWSKLVRAVDAAHPPSAPSIHARAAQTWYASTRASNLASLRALLRVSALTVRHARRPWPGPTMIPTTRRDPGFQAWLTVAESEAGRSHRVVPSRTASGSA